MVRAWQWCALALLTCTLSENPEDNLSFRSKDNEPDHDKVEIEADILGLNDDDHDNKRVFTAEELSQYTGSDVRQLLNFVAVVSPELYFIGEQTHTPRRKRYRV